MLVYLQGANIKWYHLDPAWPASSMGNLDGPNVQKNKQLREWRRLSLCGSASGWLWAPVSPTSAHVLVPHCVVGDRMLTNSTFSCSQRRTAEMRFGYKCALCSYGGKSAQKEMHLTRNTKIRWFQNVHMLSSSFVMKCATGDVSSSCRVSVCVTVFCVF